MEDGARNSPYERERKLGSLAFFRGGDLVMDSFDSLEYANALGRGLLGQLLGRQSVITTVAALSDSVKGCPDVLHGHSA